MSGRTDHSRLKQRDHMRERGSESIDGGLPSAIVIGSSRPKPPQSTKAEQHAECARAWEQWRATRASS